MTHLSLQNIGPAIRKARGDDGIREIAKVIGISPATLSRIENGKLPDIETFSKLCKWLKADPGQVLGVPSEKKAEPTSTRMAFHLKADKNLHPSAAKALADMILAAQIVFDE